MKAHDLLPRPSITVTSALLLSLLAGCGGGGSSTDTQPPDKTPTVERFQCNSASPKPPAVAQGTFSTGLQPGNFDLRTVPESPIGFARYDLKSSMSYSYGFAIQDFDCDGRQDVSFFDSYTTGRRAFRPEPGAIGYLQWNSGGLEQITAPDTFPELVTPPVVVMLFERHVSVDINGDGLPDIVGVVNSHGAVAAYLNPGQRNAPWQRRYLSTMAPGAVNIASGDIDGDGHVDVVVAMRDQSSTDPDPSVRGLMWLRNPGTPDGTWVQENIAGSEGLVDPRTVATADFDGDGRLDVVVSDASTGQLAWFKRAIDGSWTRRAIPGALTIHGHFGLVADVDGDGRIDIVQPVYQGIMLLRNVDGGNTWQPIQIANFAQEDKQLVVSEVALGDIDLDGRSDLVFVVSSLTSTVTEVRRGGVYWLRQGSDSWEAYRILQQDSSNVGVSLFDYDGDGDVDIVSNAEYQANAVTVWISGLR